jgi:hypothetical protein
MPDKPSTSERIVSKTKEEIIKEALRIEQDTLCSSKGHFAAAHFWSALHFRLGLPTSVLAAIAAASAFSKSDSNIVAGLISTAVAALSATATFLNPNTRAAVHLKAGNNYDALNNKVRIFRTIECWGGDSDSVLTKRLKDFANEKDKLNRESAQPPKWAYRIAKKGIAAGEADYAVDSQEGGLPRPLPEKDL